MTCIFVCSKISKQSSNQNFAENGFYLENFYLEINDIITEIGALIDID